MADSDGHIVIDLGKVSRKKIKGLKKGKGPLSEQVTEAMAQVRASLGTAAEGKELVPVVILYQKKPKARGFFTW